MRTPSPSPVVTGVTEQSSFTAVVSSRRRPSWSTATTGGRAGGSGLAASPMSDSVSAALTMSPMIVPGGASKTRPSAKVTRTFVRGS